MSSTVCVVSFAASSMEPSESDAWCHTEGEAPSVAEVLTHDSRWLSSCDLDASADLNFALRKKKEKKVQNCFSRVLGPRTQL